MLSGLLGSIFGTGGQTRAGNDALSRATQIDQEQYDQAQKLREMVMGFYTTLEKSGAFDYGTQAQEIKSEVSQQKQQDQENAGATYRTMGYKPGDTVADNGVARVGSAYDLKLTKALEDLKTSLPEKQFQFMQFLNPSLYGGNVSQNLRADAGANYDAANKANSGLISLAGAVIPYL